MSLCYDRDTGGVKKTMDQKKTGEFIAELRKEKGLTQRELAEQLFISDKTVSKWECGNGLPEISLMLPLCKILGVNASELLAGQRLTLSEYKKEAEIAVMAYVKEKEEARFRLLLMPFVLILTLLAGITIILVAEYFEENTLIFTLLLITGFVVLFLGTGIALALEMRRAIFECPRCSHRFIPTRKAFIFSTHAHTSHRLKCPKCHHKSMCKRKLSLIKEEKTE